MTTREDNSMRGGPGASSNSQHRGKPIPTGPKAMQAGNSRPKPAPPKAVDPSAMEVLGLVPPSRPPAPPTYPSFPQQQPPAGNRPPPPQSNRQPGGGPNGVSVMLFFKPTTGIWKLTSNRTTTVVPRKKRRRDREVHLILSCGSLGELLVPQACQYPDLGFCW